MTNAKIVIIDGVDLKSLFTDLATQRLTNVGNTALRNVPNMTIIPTDMQDALSAGANSGKSGFAQKMRSRGYNNVTTSAALDALGAACGTSPDDVPFAELLQRFNAFESEIRDAITGLTDRMTGFDEALGKVRGDVDSLATATASRFAAQDAKIANLSLVNRLRHPWLAVIALAVWVITWQAIAHYANGDVQGVGNTAGKLIGHDTTHWGWFGFVIGFVVGVCTEVLIVALTLESKVKVPQGTNQPTQQPTPAGTHS